jgi:transcriptional regulator with XRE-family HTH domain
MSYREMKTSTDPTTPLGELLRRARAKADKSQDEVAAEIGISQSMWARWERGYHLPALWRFGPIASAIDCTIAELRDAAEKTSVLIHQEKLAGNQPRPQSRIEQMSAQIADMQAELDQLRKLAGQPANGGRKPSGRSTKAPAPRPRKRA